MKRLLSRKWLKGAMLLALGATAAGAEPDNSVLGTGRDGTLSVEKPGRVINTYAQVTRALAPGDTALFVSPAHGLAAGELVLVLQALEPAPEPKPTSGAKASLEQSGEEAGRWELVRVAAVSGAMVVLEQPLQNAYAAEVTQVIRVPEYQEVRVGKEGSLLAQPWDGHTGGVVAFLSRGVVRNEGRIEAQGSGLSGDGADPGMRGRDDMAYRGRGGMGLLTGGGGGGHGGAGGQGGRSATEGSQELRGQGGAALGSTPFSHLTLGANGGTGHGSGSKGLAGGRGGGLLFIRGERLAGQGTLSVNGEAAPTAVWGGAGGGGAGGGISLRFTGSVDCGSITALGGAGGGTRDVLGGAGGGGGGGRVWLQANAIEESCHQAIDVSGGAGGSVGSKPVQSGAPHAAQAGQRGTVSLRTGESSALDTTPPNTTIESAPNSLTNLTSATFRFNANESPVTYECGLDGAPFSPCGNPATFSSLADGGHSLQVRARDADGNVDPTPASYSWTVDLVPPAAPVVSAPAAGSLLNTATPTVSGTAEANSTVTILVDGTFLGTATADASGNWSFPVSTALAEGGHALGAIATDKAGNDSGTTSVHFTVDVSPPDTTVVSGPQRPTNQTSGTFDFSATETGATYTCSLDGAAFSPCDDPVTFSGLKEGNHTLQVKARDAGGREDPTPASYSWTVDLTPPPAPTFVTAPPAKTSKPSVDYEVRSEPDSTFRCSVNGAAETDCPAKSKMDVKKGKNTLAVAAVDPAGNRSALTTTAIEGSGEGSCGGCSGKGSGSISLALLGMLFLAAMGIRP